MTSADDLGKHTDGICKRFGPCSGSASKQHETLIVFMKEVFLKKLTMKNSADDDKSMQPFLVKWKNDIIYNILSYDAQRRKRALMGRFSHFQFLTFFNRYMFKLLICELFVRKLYTLVLKYVFYSSTL